MGRRRNRLADEYRSLTRQEGRDYSQPGPPAGFQVATLKVTDPDIQPGHTGVCVLMLPQADPPYFQETTHEVDLFMPAGTSTVDKDDILSAYWHPMAGRYLPLAGVGGGGKSFLAKTTVVIPKRVDETVPGKATVQPVKYDGSNFVDDGNPVEILSWISADSGDPSADPKGFIYVWVEQGADGNLYWTGEDCTIT